jgi:TPR repeat protein
MKLTRIVRVALFGSVLSCLSFGVAKADFDSGQKAYEAGRHREAFLEWEADAVRGNPIAQFLIGNMFASGEGTDLDLKKANDYYLKAAGQGHVQSAVQLATNIRLGQGAERNYQEAAKWLYMAAEAGHPIARFDLGEMFLYGDRMNNFVPEPYHAHQWFQLAGFDGIVLAQFKLAQLYFDGKGVDRDDARGFVWLTKANRVAEGKDPENKWSVLAMPLARLVPDDDEERTFRQIIKDTYALKRLELSPEDLQAAQDILASGSTVKIR